MSFCDFHRFFFKFCVVSLKLNNVRNQLPWHCSKCKGIRYPKGGLLDVCVLSVFVSNLTFLLVVLIKYYSDKQTKQILELHWMLVVRPFMNHFIKKSNLIKNYFWNMQHNLYYWFKFDNIYRSSFRFEPRSSGTKSGNSRI